MNSIELGVCKPPTRSRTVGYANFNLRRHPSIHKLGFIKVCEFPAVASPTSSHRKCALHRCFETSSIRSMSARPIDSVQEFREIVSHYTRDSRLSPSNALCLIDYQIRSASPVIVFFHCVDWSRPCKQITPVFDECSSLPELRALRFYKVDCDHQPDISSYCQITNVCRTSHICFH